jgi:hypothetical protein
MVQFVPILRLSQVVAVLVKGRHSSDTEVLPAPTREISIRSIIGRFCSSVPGTIVAVPLASSILPQDAKSWSHADPFLHILSEILTPEIFTPFPKSFTGRSLFFEYASYRRAGFHGTGFTGI